MKSTFTTKWPTHPWNYYNPINIQQIVFDPEAGN